jgi:hypothetical protein
MAAGWKEAIDCVTSGKGLEAVCVYNVPVETTPQRRVNGLVVNLDIYTAQISMQSIYTSVISGSSLLSHLCVHIS